MAGTFQTTTKVLQAPGVAGDFASANPRATNLSSQIYNSTGFQAGPNGLTIGLFAWLDQATYQFANNYGPGAPAGFVHNSHEALITTYLTAYGMTIPAGFPCSDIFDAGDFFVVNNGTNEATPGMKAYANNVTGVATFAAAGAPVTAGTGTAGTISAQTGSSAASTITDNVFTTGPAVTGTLVPGGVLSGTGVATGTVIVAQLTGTAGGVGTYSVFPRDQTVASTTISETYGLLTVGGTVTGTFGVGQTLTGTNVTAGSTIAGAGTGTGGAGTYYTQTQTAASASISSYSNTETAWYCRSFGQPGDLVKISSRAMG
ncbi:MAG: hypothetical protein P4L90_26060 [Rhodopila sp.]|nr:hypothetical protein [Rhodopila sp.]